MIADAAQRREYADKEDIDAYLYGRHSSAAVTSKVGRPRSLHEIDRENLRTILRE
jgi:hypothetical protein